MLGDGIRSRVADERVSLGNRRLMAVQQINHAQAAGAILRLETEGKTAMLVARGGVLAGVVADERNGPLPP